MAGTVGLIELTEAWPGWEVWATCQWGATARPTGRTRRSGTPAATGIWSPRPPRKGWWRRWSSSGRTAGNGPSPAFPDTTSR